MYKLRFHLAAGPNYKMWQVKNGKNVVYYDPEKVDILMYGCRLKNRRSIAERIFAGEDKSVCAWVDCKDVVIKMRMPLVGPAIQLSYNPRVKPFWVENNVDVDNRLYQFLHTSGRGIYRPAC